MSTVLTANKMASVTRSNFTQETSVTFPAGGISDQKPIINLLMTNQSAAERIDQYFDIGQTDAAKDLDVITSATMVPIYLDPAYTEGLDSAMLGMLPPKCLLMRCLVGSGLLYLNQPYPLNAVPVQKIAPITLHEEAGIFSYAFPRATPHRAIASDPAIPANKHLYPLSLVSIYLRTFELYNRFQIIMMK